MSAFIFSVVSSRIVRGFFVHTEGQLSVCSGERMTHSSRVFKVFVIILLLARYVSYSLT